MTAALLSDWWGIYLGLSFVEGGRDGDELDCWGLVRRVLREQCSLELPGYDVVATDNAHGAATTIALSVGARETPWTRVEHGFERAFDVARIMRPAKVNGQYVKLPWHVGIVTRPGHLLHMDKPTGAIEVAFRDDVLFSHHFSMPPRDVTLYRHEALS